MNRFAIATLASMVVMAGRPTPAVAEPMLSIGVAARAIQPGELVVLTISTDAAATSVDVKVFGRQITAFPLSDGGWRALVGVDLEQRVGRHVATVEATVGETIIRQSRELVVVGRAFPTRTLQVNPEFVNPSPALLVRIADEQKFTREIYSVSAAERLWSEPFVRPVPQAANSRFGTRSVLNGERRSPHAGTDFMSPSGTPVKAPNSGRILAARELFFTGNTVIIDHGLGVFSLLAHLSRIDVREGERVTSGQIVGLVGATGRVTGPHLHWALSVAGARVDPLSLLALLGRP